MNRVRPRPWQVFFALWIPMAALWWWLFESSDEPRDWKVTAEMLAKAPRVSARVVSGYLDVGRRAATTATVKLSVPWKQGTATCQSTLTVEEFHSLRGKEVMVWVRDGPVPRCYTATAFRMIDAGNEPFVGPMLFGAMLAWLLYYPLTRMEWSSAGSLKSRWDAERAAERAQSAAPPARP